MRRTNQSMMYFLRNCGYAFAKYAGARGMNNTLDNVQDGFAASDAKQGYMINPPAAVAAVIVLFWGTVGILLWHFL